MADTAELTLEGDMAPTASPGGRRRFAGVRRVNNLPIWILGAVVLAFALVALTITIQRANRTTNTVPEEKPQNKQQDASRATNAILGTPTNIAIAPDKTPPKTLAVAGRPLGDPMTPGAPGAPAMTANGVPIVTPGGADMPPPPPPGGGINNTGVAQPVPLSPAQEARAKRLQARYAMLEAAINSPTAVRSASARSPGSAPPASAAPATSLDGLRAQLASAREQGDTTAGNALGQLDAFQRAAAPAGGAPAPGSGDNGGAGLNGTRNSYSEFSGRQGEDRWRATSAIQAPRSPYELRAGFVIPATLISGVNSDLPGTIIGQVSQNVWDTPTGRHLLLPQGSRLVGSYSANVAFGQNRVLIAWQRIIFPDGKALDLGSMPGADAAGYAGFKDKSDSHFLRVITQALLLSAVTAGATISQPQGNFNSNGRQSASSALSEALGQQLGQVTSQLIGRNLTVSPTLVIRPGFRFNVVVVKDLTFSKPYQSFDY